MRSALASIHANAKLPDGHSSNDHLNKQAEVAVDLDVAQEWQLKLAKATEEAEAQGTKLVWFIVDGFVLYWDPEVSKALDVKILLRVPRETLKARREGRSYALQSECLVTIRADADAIRCARRRGWGCVGRSASLFRQHCLSGVCQGSREYL